jgi:hypothetical protein
MGCQQKKKKVHFAQRRLPAHSRFRPFGIFASACLFAQRLNLHFAFAFAFAFALTPSHFAHQRERARETKSRVKRDEIARSEGAIGDLLSICPWWPGL